MSSLSEYLVYKWIQALHDTDDIVHLSDRFDKVTSYDPVTRVYNYSTSQGNTATNLNIVDTGKLFDLTVDTMSVYLSCASIQHSLWMELINIALKSFVVEGIDLPQMIINIFIEYCQNCIMCNDGSIITSWNILNTCVFSNQSCINICKCVHLIVYYMFANLQSNTLGSVINSANIKFKSNIYNYIGAKYSDCFNQLILSIQLYKNCVEHGQQNEDYLVDIIVNCKSIIYLDYDSLLAIARIMKMQSHDDLSSYRIIMISILNFGYDDKMIELCKLILSIMKCSDNKLILLGYFIVKYFHNKYHTHTTVSINISDEYLMKVIETSSALKEA